MSVLATALALTLGACGDGDGDDGGGDAQATADAGVGDGDGAPSPTDDGGAAVDDDPDDVATTDEAPPAPPSDETCGDPATPIAVGETVQDTFPGTGSVYYCVEVPPGVTTLEVALTGLTADVDLWVAHDTFDDLSGGLALRFSDTGGTADERVTITPSLYRGDLIGFDTYADVTPGPYWIELTGMGDESAYALSVTSTGG